MAYLGRLLIHSRQHLPVSLERAPRTTLQRTTQRAVACLEEAWRPMPSRVVHLVDFSGPIHKRVNPLKAAVYLEAQHKTRSLRNLVDSLEANQHNPVGFSAAQQAEAVYSAAITMLQTPLHNLSSLVGCLVLQQQRRRQEAAVFSAI